MLEDGKSTLFMSVLVVCVKNVIAAPLSGSGGGIVSRQKCAELIC